jgi:hypothetical protein
MQFNIFLIINANQEHKQYSAVNPKISREFCNADNGYLDNSKYLNYLFKAVYYKNKTIIINVVYSPID